MVLIKLRLLIFLVLIRFGLASKYGIIFQISILYDNYQTGKAKTEAWFTLTFKWNMFLDCLIFKLILYQRLNTTDVCLLFIDLTLNTKQATAKKRIHLFIHNIYEKKCIKRKIVKLQMGKNELTGWKV